MIWILLALMTLITFYNRYALFSPLIKIPLGSRAQSFLRYTAPAILTSLWVPIVFVKDKNLNTNLTDPYLAAGLITVVVSLLIKKPLVIVITGLLAFSMIRIVVG
jgi:branched chain amino acid efflux pump